MNKINFFIILLFFYLLKKDICSNKKIKENMADYHQTNNPYDIYFKNSPLNSEGENPLIPDPSLISLNPRYAASYYYHDTNRFHGHHLETKMLCSKYNNNDTDVLLCTMNSLINQINNTYLEINKSIDNLNHNIRECNAEPNYKLTQKIYYPKIQSDKNYSPNLENTLRTVNHYLDKQLRKLDSQLYDNFNYKYRELDMCLAKNEQLMYKNHR